MPHRRILHLAVGDAEHPAGDVEHTLLDPVVGEVGPEGLGVEVVLLLLDQIGPVEAVPPVDAGRAGHVPALALEQRLVVGLQPLGGRVHDLLDEVRRRLGAADHLVGAIELGVVRESQQVRQAASQLDQAVEHRHVPRVGAVLIGHEHLLPHCFAAGVGHDREVVGIVDRERDLAVRPRRMAVDEVLRQSLEVGRAVEHHRGRIAADVAVELLAELDLLLAQRLDLPAGRIVLVDAREPEVAQRGAEVVPGLVVELRGVEGGERVVDPAIERQPRGVGRDILGRLLGRVAHDGVGMHLLDQARLRSRLVELEQRVVVGLERVRNRARTGDREHALDRALGAREAILLQPGEGGSVRAPGPERGVGRDRDRGGRHRVRTNGCRVRRGLGPGRSGRGGRGRAQCGGQEHEDCLRRPSSHATSLIRGGARARTIHDRTAARAVALRWS